MVWFFFVCWLHAVAAGLLSQTSQCGCCLHAPLRLCAQLSGTDFVLLLHHSAFYFTQSPFENIALGSTRALCWVVSKVFRHATRLQIVHWVGVSSSFKGRIGREWKLEKFQVTKSVFCGRALNMFFGRKRILMVGPDNKTGVLCGLSLWFVNVSGHCDVTFDIQQYLNKFIANVHFFPLSFSPHFSLFFIFYYCIATEELVANFFFFISFLFLFFLLQVEVQ